VELRASIRFVEPNDRNEQIYFYASDITVFYISFTRFDPDSDDAKLISDHIVDRFSERSSNRRRDRV